MTHQEAVFLMDNVPLAEAAQKQRLAWFEHARNCAECQRIIDNLPGIPDGDPRAELVDRIAFADIAAKHLKE